MDFVKITYVSAMTTGPDLPVITKSVKAIVLVEDTVTMAHVTV